MWDLGLWYIPHHLEPIIKLLLFSFFWVHLIQASKRVCWGFSESLGIVWGLQGGALWAVGEKTSEDTIPPGLGSPSPFLLPLGKIHLQTSPRKSWINFLDVLGCKGKRQTLWHPWLWQGCDHPARALSHWRDWGENTDEKWKKKSIEKSYRISEWLGLRKDLKGPLVQLPVMGRTPFTRSGCSKPCLT